MTFSQTSFTLWTGIDASNYNNADWAKIVKVAEIRLSSFLCLPNGLPTDPNSATGELPLDLQELFANFLAEMLEHQGISEEVQSKHVRNFTINFKTTATNAFAKIAQQYEDIIEFYSNCGSGFAVEKNAVYGCEKGCACHE